MNSNQLLDDNAHDSSGDSFEKWLQACPPAEPPAALRDRCWATIPAQMGSVSAPGATSGLGAALPRSLWRRSWVKAAVATSFLAATVLAAFIFTAERPLILADVIEKTQQAPAAHLVDTTSGSRGAPGELHCREQWVLKGVGTLAVWSVDGKVTRRQVTRDGTITNWDIEKNEVVIEPTASPVDGALWMTTLQQLEITERVAKKQMIPIVVEDVRAGGLPIRRVHINGLRHVSTAGSATVDIIIDIDSSSRRLLRFASHVTSVEKNTLNASSLGASAEQVIDYPDPKTIDRAMFALTYPPSVKVIRHENPEFIRRDEAALRLLADGIKEYRAEHGDRFPTEWRKELLPYFRKKGPARPYLTSDEMGRENSSELLKDPNYLSWKFEHSGEKYGDFADPDHTVIASHAYIRRFQEGFRLLLYATGRIEVIRPTAASPKQGAVQ